jgi:hypothetical protein
MRNLIIGNMLSLGGERVLKFSELQLNDPPHTAYGFGGLKRYIFYNTCLHRKCTCSTDSFIFII